MAKKNLEWRTKSAKKAVQDFPKDIRNTILHQLNEVQNGLDPYDFKPMTTVGVGAFELREKDSTNLYRVIYVAKFPDNIYVLHAFTKKTQQTRDHDINVARTEYKSLVNELKSKRK